MRVIKKIAEIKSEIAKLNQKIAFVPTMGALHDGHLALVKKAGELADIVVVSIFVNKAQFNDLRDYEKYPRQDDLDLKKLENCGVDLVFLPDEKEMFADDFSLKIVPTKMTDCLCGSARVGHFEGVALVVTKLFNIIKPQIAIFGEKDFQQLQIIKKLVKDLNLDVEIFSNEIVREKSGLAMSSRNQRLSEASKIKAANIFRILTEIKDEVANDAKNMRKILQNKREEFLKIGFEKVDYLEIRSTENLELIENFDSKKSARIFVAVYLDGVRLIDNLSFIIYGLLRHCVPRNDELT